MDAGDTEARSGAGQDPRPQAQSLTPPVLARESRQLPSRVFLDTSGVYEAADRTAARHSEAARALQSLSARRARLTITDLVLAELHGLALGRLGPAPALELVDRVVGSARVELVAVGLENLHDAIALVRARPGRGISLVDATSFVIMRAEGIETAFTLDSDFAAEGFATLP